MSDDAHTRMHFTPHLEYYRKRPFLDSCSTFTPRPAQVTIEWTRSSSEFSRIGRLTSRRVGANWGMIKLEHGTDGDEWHQRHSPILIQPAQL